MRIRTCATSYVAFAVSALVAAAAHLGCGGSARRGIPVAEPIPLTDEQLVRGQRVFMNHCHQCHPGGAAGLAPAINDKPLPGWLMRLQIRRGLGAMPAFSEQMLADEQVDAVVAYLNHLQSLDPPRFARSQKN